MSLRMHACGVLSPDLSAFVDRYLQNCLPNNAASLRQADQDTFILEESLPVIHRKSCLNRFPDEIQQ